MTHRVVVLGAGAAGLAAANRLARHAVAGIDIEVVLVDRSAEHVFAPGFVTVLFGEAEPEAFRRPVRELARPEIRVLTGEVTRLDVEASTVEGSFDDLAYDEVVLALGPDVGWPDGPPACGELAPWTLKGALAGREALRRLRPEHRVVVGPVGLTYRCPPAVFDLAVRIRRLSGAQVDVVHPWPRPLSPFGDAPAAAFAAMLADAGVGYHGEFVVDRVLPDQLTSSSGDVVPYDVALLVPPHRPPALVASSPLAGPAGWPQLTFPTFTHPAHPNVTAIGDLAAPTLQVGMAGTLALFEAGHVADRIAAAAGGGSVAQCPRMSGICFVDLGDVGSLLHCDFTGPATGTGPPTCVLMPPLRYFRRAKQLFAEEWFATMLNGEVV
ncbi:MAG: FAD-dependent oxidoreductase [Acidimicrobiales bacterium]